VAQQQRDCHGARHRRARGQPPLLRDEVTAAEEWFAWLWCGALVAPVGCSEVLLTQ
jgi:hypothetical protein